jgi:hypothetical protein
MDDRENKLERVQEYRNRFIRWQQLTYTQLSNTNNLLLTLTLGMLAFSVSKTGLKLPTNGTILFITISGYILLLTSIIMGLLLTINRLADFRETKDLVKYKLQRFETKNKIKEHGDIGKINATINKLTTTTEKRGKHTWCLLLWQLWTFLLGSILSLTTIIIQNI